MKILCLHGNGTNSEVLKLQSGEYVDWTRSWRGHNTDENTAPLRHELEEQHEYEFVEGTIPMPLSTMIQEIELFSRPESQFYAFYNPDDLPTFHKAISQLDEYLIAEGPFDAILGFSAGAVLAALCMAMKGLRGEKIPVKCAIFVASATSDNEKAYIGLDQHTGPFNIPIPSAHIWGANDTTAPTGGRDISLLFDASLRSTFVHDGGHEFPRKQSWTAAAQVVQRALQQGREMSK